MCSTSCGKLTFYTQPIIIKKQLQQMEVIMQRVEITGRDLLSWFRGGLRGVQEQRSYLNQINVFPVKDGDTGTNLLLTLQGMVEKSAPKDSFTDMVNELSSTGFMHARGNSGSIFASWLGGFASAFTHEQSVDVQQFTKGATLAVDAMYSAVENPVEGTMLTVIKAWTHALEAHHDQKGRFKEVLAAAYASAHEALEKTPQQLPILKKYQVVDAGAKGFVAFLQGINAVIEGHVNFDEVVLEDTSESQLAFEGEESQELNYRYCTECILKSDRLPIDSLRAILREFGDSIVVNQLKDQFKMHLHTDFPEKVMETLSQYGTLSDQKADDMLMQQRLKAMLTEKGKQPIGLVADSIADIPLAYKDEWMIHTIPLTLNMDQQSYLDKLTVKADQVYRYLDTGKEYPSSSLPEPGRIKAMYEELLNYYDTLVVISVSSKLSGTYDALKRVADAFNIASKRIVVIDSMTNSAAEGLIVEKAAKLIDAGEHLEAIESQLAQTIPNSRIYVCLETLKYAVRSGRVPNTVGNVAIKLGIRPIMSISEGNGSAFGAAWSQKGITKKIMKLTQKISQQKGIESFGIVHALNPSLAEDYARQVAEITGLKPSFISEISAVTGLHAGNGAVAVAWIQKEV